MIRVLHVVVAGEIGGAEHMLRDLAHDDPAHGVEHVIALLTPIDALGSFFTDAGLRVRDGGRIREDPLSQLGRTFGRSTVRWLAGLVREEDASIVHLHTFASQVVGTRAALATGARAVRTEHSTRVYDDASCWPFSRWSLVRTDAVVAISAHVRDAALARAPFVSDRIRVVANGVDVERFSVVERAAPRADAPFTFALVGRLEPRKGVDRALRALARVPNARLEIVGDGAEGPRLRALASELTLGDRVAFHGYLDDPRPVLARADAALASSRKEGLGIAFLEAMATGLPLVTVPVGGLVEIVRSGETGLVAASDDEASLADAMRALASDRTRAATMGAAARADVVQRFSIAAMRAGYARVYGDVVTSPRTG